MFTVTEVKQIAKFTSSQLDSRYISSHT